MSITKDEKADLEKVVLMNECNSDNKKYCTTVFGGIGVLVQHVLKHSLNYLSSAENMQFEESQVGDKNQTGTEPTGGSEGPKNMSVLGHQQELIDPNLATLEEETNKLIDMHLEEEVLSIKIHILSRERERERASVVQKENSRRVYEWTGC